MTQAGPGDPLDRFRALLAEQLGLAFEDVRLAQLGELLEARSAAHGMDRGAYLARFEREPWREELAILARSVTVGETYFFRHSSQFDALRSLLQRWRGPLPPRLASLGCASGEEAYSLAILLRERWPDAEPSIVAVDVNPAALALAERGRYSAWSLRETPPAALAAWFRADGREYVIDERIRRSVRLRRANLAADAPELLAPGAFDIIFCRNVLMYFTPEQFRAGVRRLARALAPQGYLFLGSAETLRGVSQDFHLCHADGAFYYRLKPPHALGAEPAPRSGSAHEGAPSEVSADAWVAEIGRAAARIMALSDASPETRPLAARHGAPRAAARGGARPSPAPAATALRSSIELLQDDRFSEALAELRQLPPELAAHPEALLLEAVLLSSSGQLGDAQAVCERLLEQDELNAGAHYVLALCSAGNGELGRAAQHDRVANYLDPGFAMPKLHLGLLLRRGGQRAAARAELDQARSLLEREDASRLILFGGGFNRHALLALCDAELELTAGRA